MKDYHLAKCRRHNCIHQAHFPYRDLTEDKLDEILNSFDNTNRILYKSFIGFVRKHSDDKEYTSRRKDKEVTLVRRDQHNSKCKSYTTDLVCSCNCNCGYCPTHYPRQGSQ